jgi:5-methylcytosine-specific restriction protein B
VSFRREDGIFMKFCRKALEAYNNTENKEAAPKYVFIIDEINRGELSKIFGELFFCIDPGYRGENGKIKTQYCNLWKESDRFGGHDTFFIPKNVYIISTMNDIDRSVESMDFAMRRRFAFKEIQASETMEMIRSNDNLREFYPLIEERMKNLNLCILTIQGFSSAYQIGAAYFLKLTNYLEEDKLTEKAWENLWSNHLQGLLFEYLRGLPNADEELQILYRAFLLEEKYKLNEGKVVKDE